MKKIKYSISVLILLLFATILVPSCVDDNVEGDAFYTFTGETVASYCHFTVGRLFGGIGGRGGHCQIAGSHSGDYLFIGS